MSSETSQSKPAEHSVRAGAAAFITPVLAVVVAYLTGRILLLDYVHVLLGAIWTGVDVFLGLIFAGVIKTVDAKTRRNIAIRMLPMTLYFIASVSIVVPAAGMALAFKEGIFSLSLPLFTYIIIVGTALVVTGFATIVPCSWIIMRSASTMSDELLRRYTTIITSGALVQMVLQVAIISLMAYIVVYL